MVQAQDKKWNIPVIVMPTEDELQSYANNWWRTQENVSFLAWNDTLRNNSFPLYLIKVKSELIERILHLVDTRKEYNSVLNELQKEFHTVLSGSEFKNEIFFAKTISRSPKDAAPDCKFNSVDEFLQSIINSMRCFDDLCVLVRCDIPQFVIRPFIEINKKYEWRVIIQNGKLNGISQYFYNEIFKYSDKEIGLIELQIRDFINKICIPNIKTDNFIVDIVCNGTDKAIIIETNPFGLSDPCLFISYDNLSDRIIYNSDTF